MENKVIELMIADDHKMIREGIKQLLEFDGTYRVIEQANDGEECIEKLKDIRPDVLLLDINMPNRNGIDTLKTIRQLYPNQKILMLTVHNEVDYVIKAMDLGANGYILKDSESAELKFAIEKLMNGDIYVSPDIIPMLNARMVSKDMDKEKIDSLTDREIEVLILMSGGMFNKEIANKLNISERTVKNHISNIFKKIDVSDRTQAAVFAIKNNIFTVF